MTHSSYNSCNEIKALFLAMFCDSEVSKQFSLGKTKCQYFINYGVAPYVKEVLLRGILASPDYVVPYDESLNRTMQKEQMDIITRYSSSER